MSESAKSDLQIRAEEIKARFKDGARKPIVIEFAGLPKAGKTSAITHIAGFLKRCGFRVRVVIERASVCPIRDKKLAAFNVWTACTTLAEILANTQEPPTANDPEILILDRGLFDALCWMKMMENLARLESPDRQTIENFLLLSEWSKRISAIILMLASKEDAMSREHGLLPVIANGSIMNETVLMKFRDTLERMGTEYADRFRIFKVDTSTPPHNKQQPAVEHIARLVLDIIDQHLSENILSLPRPEVEKVFSGKEVVPAESAQELMQAFTQKGAYRPRVDAERDPSMIQLLPIAIVRDKAGNVLVLRRRELLSSNPLHERLVIWAGGHVREEDGKSGHAIERCVVRELKEELRLCVRIEDLRLRGAMWMDSDNPKTRQHVAVVYEWRAPSDDVRVSLSNAEFYERRGTSLSGNFCGPQELQEKLNQDKKGGTEAWTAAIIEEILDETRGSGRLL